MSKAGIDFKAVQDFAAKTIKEMKVMIEEQNKDLKVGITVANGSGMDSLKDAMDQLGKAYKQYGDVVNDMVKSCNAAKEEANRIETLNRK